MRDKSFPRLIRLALEEHGRLLRTVELIVLVAVAELCAPLVIRTFIDGHLRPRPFAHGELLHLALAYLALNAVAAVAGYAQAIELARIGLAATTRLRGLAFRMVSRLPMAWFDRKPVGAVVSRITNDTEAVKHFYIDVMGVVIGNSARIAGMAVAMLVLDWRLAVPCLAFLPVAIVLMLLYKRASARRWEAVSVALSALNASMSESIGGLRAIQLARQLHRFGGRFEAMAHNHYRSRKALLKLDSLLLRPLIDLLTLCCMVALLLWFGGEALAGAADIGVIYVFVNYLTRFAEPVVEIAQRLSQLQSAMASAGRVFELIELADARPPLLAGREPRDARLTAQQVCFAYESAGGNVLSDISFDLAPGRMLAIVGPTGSGKSTVAALLRRFYKPCDGSITLGGVPLDAIADARFAELVCYVPQDPFLLAGTIAENIDFGLGIDRPRIRVAAERAGLDAFVRSLDAGLDTQVGERGMALSAGQRQQVILARALLRDPALLILDEASASIDSSTEASLQVTLQGLKGRVSIVIIAHRLSTLREVDEILVLSPQGSVRERGSHADLVALGGLYSRLWELQRMPDLQRI